MSILSMVVVFTLSQAGTGKVPRDADPAGKDATVKTADAPAPDASAPPPMSTTYPPEAPLIPPPPAEVSSTFVPAEAHARDFASPDASTSLPKMFIEIDAQQYAPKGQELGTLQISGELETDESSARVLLKTAHGANENTPGRFNKIKLNELREVDLPAETTEALRKVSDEAQVDVLYKAENSDARPDEQVTIKLNQRTIVDTATAVGAAPQELELFGVKIRQISERELVGESPVVRHHRVRVQVQWDDQVKSLAVGETAEIIIRGRPYVLTVNESLFLEPIENAPLETEPYQLTTTISAK